MGLEIVLFAMMTHLDRAERAYVRKRLAGETLLLFEYANGKKRLTLTDIRAKFPDLNDLEYANLLSRLQDSVAVAIGEYHRRKRPEVKVRLLVGAADAFMTMGQPEDGQRILKKAIKLSLEFEEYAYVKDLMALRRRLPEFLLGNKRAAAKWPDVDAMLLQLAEGQKNLSRIEGWLQIAQDLKMGGLEGRLAKTQALLSELPPFEFTYRSKANLFLARTYWQCENFLGKFEASVPYLEWAIDLANRNHWLWQDVEAYEAIESAHLVRALIFSTTFQFGSALAVLDGFKGDCMVLKKGCTENLIDLNRLMKTRRLLQEGSRTEIRRGLRELLREIGNPKNVGSHLYVTYLYVLVYLLEQKDFETTKPWLALLVKGMKQSESVQSAVPGFLIELAIRFAAGDPNGLENAIKRLIYFEETRKVDATFVDLIVKGFRGLAKASMNVRPAILEFIASLEQNANMESFRGHLEVFDLLSFLKKELEKPQRF